MFLFNESLRESYPPVLQITFSRTLMFALARVHFVSLAVCVCVALYGGKTWVEFVSQRWMNKDNDHMTTM